MTNSEAEVMVIMLKQLLKPMPSWQNGWITKQLLKPIPTMMMATKTKNCILVAKRGKKVWLRAVRLRYRNEHDYSYEIYDETFFTLSENTSRLYDKIKSKAFVKLVWSKRGGKGVDYAVEVEDLLELLDWELDSIYRWVNRVNIKQWRVIRFGHRARYIGLLKWLRNFSLSLGGKFKNLPKG